MEQTIFYELSIILLLTFAVSGLLGLLKQPIIIGYLIAGALMGVFFVNIVGENEAISAFSQMGVALLLFMVGLHLNPKLIKAVGPVSMVTGLGQILFTFSMGFLICMFLGFEYITSFYVATAMTFSSTIIIMKLLSDKGDIETLYGRISVGLMIFQDLVAILVLMVISSMSNGFDFNSIVFGTVLQGIFLAFFVIVIGVYVLPLITKRVAASQEMLMLFSLAWAFAVASVFMLAGFSMEIGALLAGFTLSISPYRYEISSKMKILRDFFIIIFFVFLGSQMMFENLQSYIVPIVIFSVFVLIGNPLIMMIIMGLMGYKKRNSFFAGSAIAQISEFSLIVTALGVSVGHIDKGILVLVTVVALLTMAGSSYYIIYNKQLYNRLAKYLSIFERKGKKVNDHRYNEHEEYDIILLGYSNVGLHLLDSFGKMKKKYLVIDYDPEIIAKLAREGVDCRYGDVGDSEILEEMNWAKVNMVISTIKDYDTNLLILNKIRGVNKKAIIIVLSHDMAQAMKFYEKGASYVLMPNMLGGYHTSVLIEEYGFDLQKFLAEKARHVQMLMNQQEKMRE